MNTKIAAYGSKIKRLKTAIQNLSVPSRLKISNIRNKIASLSDLRDAESNRTKKELLEIKISRLFLEINKKTAELEAYEKLGPVEKLDRSHQAAKLKEEVRLLKAEQEALKKKNKKRF